MYRMDTVLSLILLVSKMLKIPRAQVEAHFLKKLAFVTNKCLAQDVFGKCPRTTENLSKYTAGYRFPRCIIRYKQSLSELKNNLGDAFINAKMIKVTFYKPVNVALKFYVVKDRALNM